MLDNLLSLILILTPLVLGFFVPVPKAWLPIVDQVLGKLVLVILFFIGLSLSQVHNLGSQLGFIIIHVAVLALCCIGSGLIALWWFDKLHPWQRELPHEQPHAAIGMLGSVIQVGSVIVGFIVGRLLPINNLPITVDSIIKGLLMLLILLVGIQLSHSGMTLRQVLLNKRGVQVSVLFCISVALGGVVFGLMMPNVSIMQGLALSSGYGWYSLSGIVMTDAYGAIWGSVALLNDLLREFLALMFIPLLMRKYPSTAVGLGGVTSMDFTLPVIQSSGGNEVVPLAMSFGFIVNIVSPVLMVLFSSFG
jgi:uncharacterized membrane protein YbjE (DUF340 family)